MARPVNPQRNHSTQGTPSTQGSPSTQHTPGTPTLLRPRQGFDFTRRVQQVCLDLANRLSEFQHIDLRLVAIGYAQARKRVPYGTFASLTPLRFEDGRITTQKGPKRYRVQPVLDAGGQEMLYILTFYLPRFLDLSPHEKLVTILHELWHISPKFDGDLRRFPGRCYAHSSSQDAYDAHMEMFARRYRETKPPAWEVLECCFDTLHARHGAVWGNRIPRPRIVECA